MLDQRIKQTIIDALMKVVDGAPTRNYTAYQYGITQASFDIWMNYVNSTMNITARYIDMNLCISFQNRIQQITFQNTTDYAAKINSICQILLDLARQIIYL